MNNQLTIYFNSESEISLFALLRELAADEQRSISWMVVRALKLSYPELWTKAKDVGKATSNKLPLESQVNVEGAAPSDKLVSLHGDQQGDPSKSSDNLPSLHQMTPEDDAIQRYKEEVRLFEEQRKARRRR